MTTELENDVREAMAARAGALPNAALARVRAVGYRPRPLRLPAAAAVLAGAATAGTVMAVVLTGGAPAAYAGWSATPTSASTPSPQAAASCQGQLSSSQSAPHGQLGSGAWQNVLTDVRGPFTVALFQDDGADAASFTSSSFTEVNQLSSASGAGLSEGSTSVNGSSTGGGAGHGAASVTVSRTSSVTCRTCRRPISRRRPTAPTRWSTDERPRVSRASPWCSRAVRTSWPPWQTVGSWRGGRGAQRRRRSRSRTPRARRASSSYPSRCRRCPFPARPLREDR